VFKDERTSEFPWYLLTLMKVVMVEVEEVMETVVLIIDTVTYPLIYSEKIFEAWRIPNALWIIPCKRVPPLM